MNLTLSSLPADPMTKQPSRFASWPTRLPTAPLFYTNETRFVAQSIETHAPEDTNTTSPFFGRPTFKKPIAGLIELSIKLERSPHPSQQFFPAYP